MTSSNPTWQRQPLRPVKGNLAEPFTLENALMRVVKVLVVGMTPSEHILSYTASALCGCPSFVHVVNIRLYVSASGASPCGRRVLLCYVGISSGACATMI